MIIFLLQATAQQVAIDFLTSTHLGGATAVSIAALLWAGYRMDHFIIKIELRKRKKKTEEIMQ